MALSKTFLLLGLALAVVLLISSEVSSARELAEATHTQSADMNMEKTNYDTNHYRYRHEYDRGHKYGHGKGHGHGGYGYHGKLGHGGHPGHGADGPKTEHGEN